uniref:Histone-lysine N-methyltransferase n=1 Tax=Picocystis salinarum TaxID=88271 RepID=A0A7S3XCY3_9CHLO
MATHVSYLRRKGLLMVLPGGKRNTSRKWSCALCGNTYENLRENALGHWLHEEGVPPCSFVLQEPTREQMQAVRDLAMRGLANKKDAAEPSQQGPHQETQDEEPEKPTEGKTTKKKKRKRNGLQSNETKTLQRIVEELVDFSDRLPINCIKEHLRPQAEWNEWSSELSMVNNAEDVLKPMFWCADAILSRYFLKEFSMKKWKEECEAALDLAKPAQKLARLMEQLDENLDWEELNQLWLVMDHRNWVGWQSNVAGPSAICEACGRDNVEVGELKRMGESVIIHEQCLNWLPNKLPIEQMMVVLPEIIQANKKNACQICKQPGAMVPCAVARCKKFFHFPCALESNCTLDGHGKMLFCVDHSTDKYISMYAKPEKKHKRSKNNKDGKKKAAKCASILDEAKAIPPSEMQLMSFLKLLKSVLDPKIPVSWCKQNAELFLQFRHFLDQGVFPDILREEIAKSLFSELSIWEVHSLSRKVQAIITKHQHEQVEMAKQLPHDTSIIGSTITVMKDISYGMERVKIPAAVVVTESILNALKEGNKLPRPKDFQYLTTRVMLDKEMRSAALSSKVGCDCKGSCCLPWNKESCQHFVDFREDFPAFNHTGQQQKVKHSFYNRFGRLNLSQPGTFVYECNDLCECSPSCSNRVAQRGLQLSLQVVYDESKGWGVVTLDPIKRGTFVCEYAGETINTFEAERRGLVYDKQRCSFLYNLDFHVPRASSQDPSKSRNIEEDHDLLAIDATFYGNVARFFNHSCDPNLISFPVLWDTMDFRLPHICFFSTRDIAVGEELCYDYHYCLQEDDQMICHCGASNCRGRLL